MYKNIINYIYYRKTNYFSAVRKNERLSFCLSGEEKVIYSYNNFTFILLCDTYIITIYLTQYLIKVHLFFVHLKTQIEDFPLIL